MREPHFWSGDIDPKSREAAPLTRVLLTPFAWLYGAVTARRIANTCPTKVPAIVICVGNITVGGVGKSPVVAYLRRHLSNLTGRQVATLSRGYGGRITAPTQVDPNAHTARDVGDEPLMLAAGGQSWIGVDRGQAGNAMSANGVDIILMDDGHQNPGLYKDFSFVVVDSDTAFGNGFVVPKGPLREPAARGLSRADAIILMGDGPVPEPVSQSRLPVLRAHIRPAVALPVQAYVAFAGIGRPEKFFDTLKREKIEVLNSVPFADHHTYSERDIRYLHDLASDHAATLLTTEKDFARLPPTMRSGILPLPIDIEFSDVEALDGLLAPVFKDKWV